MPGVCVCGGGIHYGVFMHATNAVCKHSGGFSALTVLQALHCSPSSTHESM